MGSRTRGSERLRKSLWNMFFVATQRNYRKPFGGLETRTAIKERRILEIMDGKTPTKTELAALQQVVR